MNELVKCNPDEMFLDTLPEKYYGMSKIIKENYPEIKRATNLFQKSQSQLMDNLLTVTALTPIRNLRQMLAEMQRLRQALGEAYFNTQKTKIKIEKKQQELENAAGLDKDLLQLQIDELNWKLESTMEYVAGAIRKLTSYTLQFKAVQEKYNLTGFTEADFEKEEEAYHISRACQQALTAARSHYGVIDEGNMIYFQQLGINGASIQQDMTDFFKKEQELLKKGAEPSHLMEIDWILSMIKKYEGCTRKFMEFRGQIIEPLDITLEK